jgi:triphosphoribosyl-dephospho-CoA synthase
LWEATARKPGNVHRYRDFDDVTYMDFVLSGAAVGPVLDAAGRRSVGETVLEGVRATRQVVVTNTNLGILLLLAPLAAVPADEELCAGIVRVLDRMTVADARHVFRAIRLAAPGGLGTAPAQDVRGQPTLPLREIMALAADRDLIALQYADGFREVFDEGVPALQRSLDQGQDVETAIIGCHLHLLAGHADSLIARKRGRAEADEASRRAAHVLASGWPQGPASREALAVLDAWLRAEDHARNPGTTADVVTACLFVVLREGLIQLPRAFTGTG